MRNVSKKSKEDRDWMAPEVLNKIWTMYRNGFDFKLIAHACGLSPNIVHEAVQVARETCGVRDAMDRYGIKGTPQPAVRR